MELYNDLTKNTDLYLKTLAMDIKRQQGIYYTDLELTDIIMEKVLEKISAEEINEVNFLEPCVGSGNFVISYIKNAALKFKLTSNEIRKLIKNIYVCDSDKSAIDLFIRNLKYFIKKEYQMDLTNDDLPNIGGSLIYNLQLREDNYIGIDKYFGDIKFDVIVTNPPYKGLRAERRHYKTDDDYFNGRNYYNKVKEKSKHLHPLSGALNANIYRYFVEEIYTKYSKPDSIISILVPSSILTDKSCYDLRNKIIDFNITDIIQIPENNKYIDASQAMTNIITDRNHINSSVSIEKLNNGRIENYLVPKKNIVDEAHNNSILIMSNEDYELLNKLKSIPKVKDHKFIVNMRGELDITNNKDSITSKKTEYPLIRGRDIDRYCEVKYDKIKDYATKEFVNNSFKQRYVIKNRLACQQIVNMNKKTRIGFTLIKENTVLANSCNFIFIKDNDYGIDEYYALAILNSKYCDWYFKIFSSNNHVNNYEIDLLPFPIGNSVQIQEVSSLAKEQVLEYSNLRDNQINKIVTEIIDNFFGVENKINLNSTQIDELANKGLKEKNKILSTKGILNDKQYTLSELDLEIIKSVPQGGNWKNIPDKTIEKSKRLMKIRETGGRTTLYGRIDYTNPSYTITTYFNRPGNGCYIHPTQDRVLTTREGARIQCFPDDYYFYGNQRDILNQIGNAVPPLMGYLIAKKIKENLNVKKSLDLFSGAGGLLYGFKMAGVEHVLANDIDRSACVTLKINNPEVNVLCDDVTNDYTKEIIIDTAIKNNVDIICGGPPCQGFSLAGFRKSDDPRNKLVLDFADIIKSVEPKVFVFENVVGLLSYNKGETFNEIKKMFLTLGYKLHAETLDFSDYGVPQRRRRVIIIGVRNNINIEPSKLFPDKITKNKKISVMETIGDLDININSSNMNSKFISLMKNKISYDHYIDSIKENCENEIGEQLSIF